MLESQIGRGALPVFHWRSQHQEKGAYLVLILSLSVEVIHRKLLTSPGGCSGWKLGVVWIVYRLPHSFSFCESIKKLSCWGEANIVCLLLYSGGCNPSTWTYHNKYRPCLRQFTIRHGRERGKKLPKMYYLFRIWSLIKCSCRYEWEKVKGCPSKQEITLIAPVVFSNLEGEFRMLALLDIGNGSVPTP